MSPSRIRSSARRGPLAPKPSRRSVGCVNLLIDQIQGDGLEDGAEEAVPVITYEPPTGVDLDPVTGAMTVTCHVSPEAGWLVLRPFIEGTREDVVLGMYDFTALHIYHAIRSLLVDSDIVWRQTLGPHESLPSDDDTDSTKAGDLTEASIIEGLGRVAEARFENAFAHVGVDGRSRRRTTSRSRSATDRRPGSRAATGSHPTSRRWTCSTPGPIESGSSGTTGNGTWWWSTRVSPGSSGAI